MDLRGKSVIVTGAGRGLGRAYALALGAAGASVVVNARDAASAAAVVEAVGAAGGTAVAEAVEVGSAEAAEHLVERAVEAFGSLGAVVCNAGIVRDRVLWKMSDEDFDEVVRVNLRGTFTCAKAAARRLRAQGSGGTIVLAGSPAGQRGNFGQTNYAATKAGIAAMAKTWAAELGRSDVTVNAILPTAATRMTSAIPLFAPYVEDVERGKPLPALVRRVGHFGPPEDAAGLVVFLVSEAARHVTGQCIGIGGDRISLWSCSEEIAFAFHDDGWTADDLASSWDTMLGAAHQRFGAELPVLSERPERHATEAAAAVSPAGEASAASRVPTASAPGGDGARRVSASPSP